MAKKKKINDDVKRIMYNWNKTTPSDKKRFIVKHWSEDESFIVKDYVHICNKCYTIINGASNYCVYCGAKQRKLS